MSPHTHHKQPLNRPFYEVVDQAGELLKINPSALVFQKFTCEHCGARQTIELPNRFHKTGKCQECKSTTDILKKGCGFMVVFVALLLALLVKSYASGLPAPRPRPTTLDEEHRAIIEMVKKYRKQSDEDNYTLPLR